MIASCSHIRLRAPIGRMLFATLLLGTAVPSHGSPASIEEVLATCDERIERHRKAEIRLQVQLPQELRAGCDVDIRLLRHAFRFGGNLFAFGQNGADEPIYRQRFREVMNYATLAFYWHTYEPQPGQRRTQDRMAAAEWCRRHKIRTKGHPLIWNMEPEWVRRLTPLQAEQHMWARVQDEVLRFRGQIDTWDVINETTEGFKYARQRQATALLLAYEKYGITPTTQRAFEFARRANPNAELILNDYETSAAFEDTVRRALDQQAAVDVVGIQAHMHQGYWGPRKIWDVCERFSRFGLPVHFTEVTILSGDPLKNHDWETHRTNWVSTKAGEARQAEQFSQLLHLLFSHPHVEAVTWWDLSDRHAWLGAPGGLLRKDFSAKPAWYVLRDLTQRAWTTRHQATVPANGPLHFRGFYGTYEIRVNARTSDTAQAPYRATFDVLRENSVNGTVTVSATLKRS